MSPSRASRIPAFGQLSISGLRPWCRVDLREVDETAHTRHPPPIATAPAFPPPRPARPARACALPGQGVADRWLTSRALAVERCTTQDALPNGEPAAIAPGYRSQPDLRGRVGLYLDPREVRFGQHRLLPDGGRTLGSST